MVRDSQGKYECGVRYLGNDHENALVEISVRFSGENDEKYGTYVEDIPA